MAVSNGSSRHRRCLPSGCQHIIDGMTGTNRQCSTGPIVNFLYKIQATGLWIVTTFWSVYRNCCLWLQHHWKYGWKLYWTLFLSCDRAALWMFQTVRQRTLKSTLILGSLLTGILMTCNIRWKETYERLWPLLLTWFNFNLSMDK